MIQAILVLGITGAILGAALGVADKFLKVEVDEREKFVLEHLAGANCGGCGFPGCAGFAAAIIAGETNDIKRCRPTKQENKEQIVYYLSTTPGPDGKTINLKL